MKEYKETRTILQEILNWSIDELNMTPRLHNLMNRKVRTIDEFLLLTDGDVMSWKMFGKGNLEEFHETQELILNHIQEELLVSVIPIPSDMIN